MTDPWPDGVGRHVLIRTESTNAEALRLAPTVAGPFWLLTREQTAGRGRRGRSWAMPAGNFAATLLTRPSGGATVAGQLSFVAALALHEALGAVCGPAARLTIKWPNDVLLNGGKVAGILLESAGSGARLDAVAVGIGVNLASAPEPGLLDDGALPPVSVLGETGHAVVANDFLDLLAPAFARWQSQLDRHGFAPVRAAWLSRAARLGETITARTGATARIGRFDGIDNTGALILTTDAGRETVAAADVYFCEGA